MTYYPRLPASRMDELRQTFDARIAFKELQLKIVDEVRLNRLEARVNQPSLAEVEDKRLSQANDLHDIVGKDLEAIREKREKAVAAEQLRYSIAGRFGHAIEPVLKPLGFDWKMGVGLVGAFAAREVFVSTMGIVYSVGKVEDDTQDLSATMLADTYPDGRKVWTPLVAVSLLGWFVLAMQCMSTLAIVRRETGGWKWPLIMLVYMNALAYVVCLGVYQVGKIWFV